jgi:hypothetical protein
MHGFSSESMENKRQTFRLRCFLILRKQKLQTFELQNCILIKSLAWRNLQDKSNQTLKFHILVLQLCLRILYNFTMNYSLMTVKVKTSSVFTCSRFGKRFSIQII